MVVKKCVNWLSHFLRICILRDSNLYSMTPQVLCVIMKKFTAEQKKNFGSKTTIYLSLGLQKGCPNYKRSLQLLEEKHPALQIIKFLKFFYFCGSFLPLDPDPDSEYGSGSTDPIESGSGTLISNSLK
jgi:hypothetical protein